MIEVKSNIMGALSNIRKGVLYKDEETVIDEIIQNAQRAHADTIQIENTTSTITIRDNGEGCDDPQKLFEMNDSGWKDEDEAFGEGFFSIFYLADDITCRSNGWELNLNVPSMMETGNMSIDNIRKCPCSGFEIQLSGPKVKTKMSSLLNEAYVLADVSPMEFYIEGKPYTKVEMSLSDVIEKPSFTADLKPATWGETNLYYDNRPVEESTIWHVQGTILLKKGMVTPKAPDRKSLIHDKKYDSYKEDLANACKEMYLQFIKSATDDELNRYDDGIDYYLDTEDYAPYLTLDKKVFDAPESHTNDIVDDANDILTNSMNDIIGEMHPQEINGAIKDEIKRQLRETTDIKSLKALNNGVVAWVRANDAERRRQEIAEAEYNGVCVIYAPNKLYENAYKYYDIPQLGAKMDGSYTKVYKFDKHEDLTDIEKRFLGLMGKVEKRYGLDENLFSIADIGYDFVAHDGVVLKHSEHQTAGVYDSVDNKIYLDSFNLHLDGMQDKSDFYIVMSTAYTVCHELAHCLLGTNDMTKTHDDAMKQIMDTYANCFE